MVFVFHKAVASTLRSLLYRVTYSVRSMALSCYLYYSLYYVSLCLDPYHEANWKLIAYKKKLLNSALRSATRGHEYCSHVFKLKMRV